MIGRAERTFPLQPAQPWPQRNTEWAWESDSRCFGDFAGADAAGAHPHILRPSVDHCPNPLKVGQPAPLTHIVSVGDIVARHRALAADFTSLRHFRTPPRKPHKGVELNSTGGADYQVFEEDYDLNVERYGDVNALGAAKSRQKIFTEREIRWCIFSALALINDTLFRWCGSNIDYVPKRDRRRKVILKKTDSCVPCVGVFMWCCDPCS